MPSTGSSTARSRSSPRPATSWRSRFAPTGRPRRPTGSSPRASPPAGLARQPARHPEGGPGQRAARGGRGAPRGAGGDARRRDRSREAARDGATRAGGGRLLLRTADAIGREHGVGAQILTGSGRPSRPPPATPSSPRRSGEAGDQGAAGGVDRAGRACLRRPPRPVRARARSRRSAAPASSRRSAGRRRSTSSLSPSAGWSASGQRSRAPGERSRRPSAGSTRPSSTPTRRDAPWRSSRGLKPLPPGMTRPWRAGRRQGRLTRPSTTTRRSTRRANPRRLRRAASGAEQIDLTEAGSEIKAHLRLQDVDFKGDEGPEEFLLDLVPRVIERAEWEELEAGLRQRVRALNAIRDAYFEQRIAREGVVRPGDRDLREPRTGDDGRRGPRLARR